MEKIYNKRLMFICFYVLKVFLKKFKFYYFFNFKLIFFSVFKLF